MHDLCKSTEASFLERDEGVFISNKDDRVIDEVKRSRALDSQRYEDTRGKLCRSETKSSLGLNF